jgi:hypothetical protein
MISISSVLFYAPAPHLESRFKLSGFWGVRGGPSRDGFRPSPIVPAAIMFWFAPDRTSAIASAIASIASARSSAAQRTVAQPSTAPRHAIASRSRVRSVIVQSDITTSWFAGARVIFKACRILQGWLYIHARAKFEVYTYMCILNINKISQVWYARTCIYDAHHARWDGLRACPEDHARACQPRPRDIALCTTKCVYASEIY